MFSPRKTNYTEKDRLQQYFIYDDIFAYVYDKDIAHKCKMLLKEYRDILIKEFNAVMSGGDLFFNDISDCQRAAEWLDSLIMIDKLSCNKE